MDVKIIKNELVLPKRYNQNLMERQNKREREILGRRNIDDIFFTNRPRLENPFQIENDEEKKEIEEILNFLPSSIYKKEDKNKPKCMICLSNYYLGNKLSYLPCLHIFHLDCLKKWLYQKKYCPICKYNISLESLIKLNETWYIKNI